MIGQTVSHYRIVEKLGEGGMGVVYKAEDTKLKRIVALKFLPQRISLNEQDKERFLQEARAAATLNHANVCTIYRIDEFEGQQFIEMEYVDGDTLRKRMPVQNIEEALRYAIQIGEALQEAHGLGIVHRDVKSDNIMINTKNQIKVMDFGLAKLRGSMNLTRSSSTLGTLAYMAPEQVQGGAVDARSDIFSYGAVLFEMLTGSTPFAGEHEAAVLYSIVNKEPEQLSRYRSDLPQELERIIARSLEKDPEDRYQSAADLVSELRRLLKQTGRVERPTQSVTRPVPVERPQEPVLREPAGAQRPLRKKLLFAGAGVTVLIGIVAAYLFMGRHGTIESLAVLPFEDTGASSEQEYLADGVTESIINNLTKISTLRVIPRSTAFRFRGKDLDLQDIGAKLNVHAILTGRITHRDQLLDAQVDLIDVENQSQIWGDRYQVSVAELPGLPERITRDVSAKLGIGLSKEVQQKIGSGSTQNTEAYKLYLQGRYYWNKRNAMALERAIAYFQQAIGLDPSYALAYSGLADTYILQSQYAGLPSKVTIPLTNAAARRALELDSTLAEPHTTLAFSLFEEGRLDEAEQEFKRSLQLNPRYATTYHWYGIMMGRTGDAERYLSLITQGQEIDPFSPVITLNVGAAQCQLGHFELGLQYFQKSTELDPAFASGYAWAGLAYTHLKRYAEALPVLEKAVDLSGRSSECLSYLGYFYGLSGNRQKAGELLRENQERYAAGSGSAYNVARIYLGLGEKDRVLEWLEKDYHDRSTWISSLGTDFTFTSLRSDPRFVDIVQKVRAGKY
jgi:TolB-like protein/Flp pilus assembly protein TadD/predicted Ser/Thr protein kinase